MTWEFKSGVPIYAQIAERIQAGISAGQYPPGAKIPSVREFALEAGVNPNTMQRALNLLEQKGILHSVRTSGRFVTEDQETIRGLRKQLAAEELARLFTRLTRLGMSPDEIIEAAISWSQKVQEAGKPNLLEGREGKDENR